MTDAATLFPGRLADCYAAFVAAVEAEGGATREFKKTQVSFGLERKFAWLVPLTTTTCLLLLDMYDRHADPAFRDIIEYRADKHTHQAEITDRTTIERLSAAGLFREARDWGAKRAS